eukprot:897751-Pyramimonas_sp.AAC.1
MDTGNNDTILSKSKSSVQSTRASLYPGYIFGIGTWHRRTQVLLCHSDCHLSELQYRPRTCLESGFKELNRHVHEGEREYTRSGHQLRKGRENIPASGTNHGRGERIYNSGDGVGHQSRKGRANINQRRWRRAPHLPYWKWCFSAR